MLKNLHSNFNLLIFDHSIFNKQFLNTYIVLTKQQRKQALNWYAQQSYELITIAQHFNISVEELKKELRNI